MGVNFQGVTGTLIGQTPIQYTLGLYQITDAAFQPFTLTPGTYLITHTLQVSTTKNLLTNPYFQFGGFLFGITYNASPTFTTIQGGTITSTFPTDQPFYSNQTPPPSGSYNIFSGTLEFNFTQCIHLSSPVSNVMVNFTPGSVGGNPPTNTNNEGMMYLINLIFYVVKLS